MSVLHGNCSLTLFSSFNIASVTLDISRPIRTLRSRRRSREERIRHRWDRNTRVSREPSAEVAGHIRCLITRRCSSHCARNRAVRSESSLAVQAVTLAVNVVGALVVLLTARIGPYSKIFDRDVGAWVASRAVDIYRGALSAVRTVSSPVPDRNIFV